MLSPPASGNVQSNEAIVWIKHLGISRACYMDGRSVGVPGANSRLSNNAAVDRRNNGGAVDPAQIVVPELVMLRIVRSVMPRLLEFPRFLA